MSKQEKLFGDTEVEVRKNIPLSEAFIYARKLLVDMSFSIQCDMITTVGSIRRRKETVNDIDFVVVCSDRDWIKIRNFLLTCKAKKVVSGDKIQRFILDGLQLDFYRATEDTYGIYKLIRTGSAGHNIYLAKLAIKKGMRIKYSIGVVKDHKVLAGRSESSIFTVLGLPFIEPEFREITESGKPMWELK